MAVDRLRAVVWLLIVAAALAACGRDKPSEDTPPEFSECGLPKRDPKADASLVPAPLLLDGVQVAKTEVEQGRVIAALNVPYSVQEAFGRYKKALPRTDFDVLQEDNEGFEAEVYLQSGKELGSMQIRSSTCDDAVIVYLNLPAP